jgi:glucose-1-phosphate thymidylyltransferase
MKSVILCGGRGTRLSPQTEITNKHLLPIYTKFGAIPMIWYPLNTLIKSGSKEILIISSQEHCGDIIEFLGDGKRFGVDLTYKVQDHNDKSRPVGIAGALKLISNWVHNEPFAVILGDNFYEDSFKREFDKFKTKFFETQKNYLGSLFAHVFIKEVPDPQRFGVATIKDGKVIKIVEKPKEPESNYAVTGLYLYTPHIFSLLPNLKVSGRGELEVSDINNWYTNGGVMLEATIIPNKWSDMGVPESMLSTTEYINKIGYTINFPKE